MGPFEGIEDEQLCQPDQYQFLRNTTGDKVISSLFKSQKNGTIITVTSSTANIPYPFVSVYAATKSALEKWSEGMSYELKRVEY